MTLFDGRRLTQAVVGLDVDGLRSGAYADKYFENVTAILEKARVDDIRQASPRTAGSEIAIGTLHVEAQVFTRRAPRALVAGIDVALLMLRHAAGLITDGVFMPTWERLEVEAAHDGVVVAYDGVPEHVRPILRIRGRYQDFAVLETPILGCLSRASRIATNVYDVLEVARGKPVLYFPARFDLPATQALDGYAYWLAVQRYNHDHGANARAYVSTDAQAAWWGGKGGGTMPHALIAVYMGDTAAAVLAFAQTLPPDVPRIALVDFNNDCVGDSLACAARMWEAHRAALKQGDDAAAARLRLDGVRLDTGGTMRDRAMEDGDPPGVNPKLVRLVRAALDSAWESWDVPPGMEETAKAFCRAVRIVVTGGFNRERIAAFEADAVPVDVYGVGSSLLRNDSTTNTDFTMDVVRAQVNGAWINAAKVGRRANDNPDLLPIDLAAIG
jgi:nicotinate phosphoribosyltransferase